MSSSSPAESHSYASWRRFTPWTSLLPFALLLVIAAGITALSAWAQQGLPFQDDWDLLYAERPDGSFGSDPASLFVPANDGIYPLGKYILRASWHQFDTLTPVIATSTLSMALLAAGVLIFLMRRTGGLQLQDCAIPLCCLNYAFVPSFTWSCLVSCFLCVSAVVPLTCAMLAPQQLCNRASFLVYTLGFLCLSCACGHAAYTYGMGVAVWCILGAILFREARWPWRLCLGGLGVIAAAVIVLLYLYSKTAQPAAPQLDVVRFPRVLSESLAVGVGQLGIISRGLVGVPILFALGWIVVQLVWKPASESGLHGYRLLAATSAMIVLMPQIGIALARNSGLAFRYMAFGVPVMLWIYVAARTRLPKSSASVITTAVALLYATTMLMDAYNAWPFAKERHAQAIRLLQDSGKGWSPLHVASIHAVLWSLNEDERFAGQLVAAKTHRNFGGLAGEINFDDRKVEPIATIYDEVDGWTYWACRVKHLDGIAVAAEYTPPQNGPYNLRWICQATSEVAVPSVVQEGSFQSHGRIRRDYCWLKSDDEIVWFGLDRRANVTDVLFHVLRAGDRP